MLTYTNCKQLPEAKSLNSPNFSLKLEKSTFVLSSKEGFFFYGLAWKVIDNTF